MERIQSRQPVLSILIALSALVFLVAISIFFLSPDKKPLANEVIIDFEEENGEIFYVYKTEDEVEPLPNELVERRTPISRAVALPDGDIKVLIDVSAPKYYEDERGRWWYVGYATTSKERFDSMRVSRASPLEKVLAWITPVAYAATEFLTSGTSWSTPGDWNNSDNSIECIGAGGNGAAGADGASGGGGGGGAYARVTNITLSGSIDYVVASGGSGSDTYFNGAASSTASISCAGGKNASGLTAGAGGSTADSTGTTEYAGGTGGVGQSSTSNRNSGGGGGSAGPTGAGQNGGASSASAGDGGAGGGGSNGGSSTAGTNGADSTTGRDGGHGTSGAGGGTGGADGASGSDGTVGGGGGGSGRPNSNDDKGGNGGCDTAFDATHGACGGGGGGGGSTSFGADGGNGGTYGGGGAGGGKDADGDLTHGTAGTGGAGLIVITYTPGADTTAPSPDPMTFATAPNDASASSVTMIATTATDSSSPVEYLFGFFACASNGGTGGTASSWQSSATYTDSGLQPNQCYGYKVEARDSVGNRTASSSQSEAYTAANVPGAPTLGSATVSTLTLTHDANSNPSSNPTTSFAVQITATSPTDATWLDQYVDASGNPSASAVWLTDSQLDGLVITGLEASTSYSAQSKARNASSEETALSSAGTTSTSAAAAGSTSVSRLLGGVRLIGGVRFR